MQISYVSFQTITQLTAHFIHVMALGLGPTVCEVRQ